MIECLTKQTVYFRKKNFINHILFFKMARIKNSLRPVSRLNEIQWQNIQGETISIEYEPQ